MGCMSLTRQHGSAPRSRQGLRGSAARRACGRWLVEPGGRRPVIGSRSPHGRRPLGLKRSPPAPGTTLPCRVCAQHRPTAGSCWPPRGGCVGLALGPLASGPALTPGHRLWARLAHYQDGCAWRRVRGQPQQVSTVPTRLRLGQGAPEHTGSVWNLTPEQTAPRAPGRGAQGRPATQRLPDVHPRGTLTRHALRCAFHTRSRAPRTRSSFSRRRRRVSPRNSCTCSSRPSPLGPPHPAGAPHTHPPLPLLRAPGKRFLEELCSGLWGP